MKKNFKMIMLFSAVLLIAALTGCSSASQANAMDFHAQLDLKVPDPPAGQRPKILFVGNSHLFYNGLSGMFVNIVHSQGHKSDVKELSSIYYTLGQYADMEDKGGAMLDKTLSKQHWDFVILQENVTKALSSSAADEMFPPARILDEKIKAAGGQSVFLMTWAPKDGMKIGLKKQNRETVQADLATNYMAIADELDALMIPAGIGFMRCAQENPDIELWDADGQHPSSAGSYLTACILYSVLFQESPVNCTYIGDLEPDVALTLQQTAAALVLD